MTIKNDEERINAYANCTDNLRTFLEALDNKDDRIKWNRLDRDGCLQDDGTYFRVLSCQRTAKQQIDEYKKGRKGVKFEDMQNLGVFANDLKGTGHLYKLVNKGEIVDKSALSTMAWVGQSYHNYGAAVDICIRHFGDKPTFELSDGKMTIANYYSMIGLLKLAEDCNLEWGGFWTDFPDILHFQDKAYPTLPEYEKYAWTSNLNSTWLARFYSGDTYLDKDGIAKRVATGGLAGLGLLAGIGYLFFGGKKWRSR